jgi:hypothetical protein
LIGLDGEFEGLILMMKPVFWIQDGAMIGCWLSDHGLRYACERAWEHLIGLWFGCWIILSYLESDYQSNKSIRQVRTADISRQIRVKPGMIAAREF